MAANECVCDGSIENLGMSDCPKVLKPIVGFILVPLSDSSGNDSKIAIADLTVSALQAKFQAAKPQDRFHFVGDVEDFGGDGRADPQTTDFASGTSIPFVRGRRSQTFVIPNQGAQWIGRLASWSCQKFGLILFDEAGQFGYRKVDGDADNAYPIPVNNLTWFVKDMHATYADGVGRAMGSFQYDKSLRDQDIYVSTSDVSETDMYSVVDVVYKSTPADTTSTTVFTVDLVTEYGVAQRGLDETKVKVINQNANAEVALTSFVEDSNVAGRYLATMAAAQTSGNKIYLTDKLTNSDAELSVSRRDLTTLAPTLITVS